MGWLANWLPLIVTTIAWALFFWFIRDFRGERFIRAHEERTNQLKRHGDLLERLAAAIEKLVDKGSA